MSQANSEVTFLCLNTIADYGSMADSESGLYQEVKMKLTHPRRIHRATVSSLAPILQLNRWALLAISLFKLLSHKL